MFLLSSIFGFALFRRLGRGLLCSHLCIQFKQFFEAFGVILLDSARFPEDVKRSNHQPLNDFARF
jgi:hypothetical protein